MMASSAARISASCTRDRPVSSSPCEHAPHGPAGPQAQQLTQVPSGAQPWLWQAADSTRNVEIHRALGSPSATRSFNG